MHQPDHDDVYLGGGLWVRLAPGGDIVLRERDRPEGPVSGQVVVAPEQWRELLAWRMQVRVDAP
jgi:hypothetical protein